MAYSREELFGIAKDARKKNKLEAEEKKANGYGGEYEALTYTALSLNKGKVFRLLGNPTLSRTLPTDPKESYISMIKGDNGKKFKCIWPARAENKNWPLWKIYDLIMAYSFSAEKDAKGNSIKIYNNFKTHPETFNRVAKNDSDNKWEPGWRPKCFVNGNILDRHDKAWHLENKHSKLLSKKASEMGNTGKFWFDPGIPMSAYNTIWDTVVEYYGDWEEYDVVLTKIQETPWYRAFNGEEEFIKLGKEAKEAVVVGPITEEEKAYELYDLDKIFKVTSYTKIKSHLGEFIKKVDLDFKQNFSEELDKLVEIEKEEKAKKAALKAEADKLANPEDIDVDIDVEAKEADIDAKEISELQASALKAKAIEEDKNKLKPTKSRTRNKKVVEKPEVVSIDWKGLSDGSFNGTKYLGVAQMTDEEKAMVVSVNEDGSFKYTALNSEGKEYETLQNTVSKFDSPDVFHIDPLDGEVF